MYSSNNQEMVKRIIENYGNYEWTLQGFGMLRTYLDSEKKVRLHFYHKDFAVPNVSLIHTHPWSFKSNIVAGSITDTRYEPWDETGEGWNNHKLFMRQKLLCGEGGCLKENPEIDFIRPVETKTYKVGDTYKLPYSEIHSSAYEDGTVTIIESDFVNEDKDHAFVFWPKGEAWVSAEPRPATQGEIETIFKEALKQLDNA